MLMLDRSMNRVPTLWERFRTCPWLTFTLAASIGSMPCAAWASPAESQPPTEGERACLDDLLGEAKDKEDSGYFGIAAELYVEAYRTCLAPGTEVGFLDVDVVTAAVKMYIQAALTQADGSEMLVRATALLDELLHRVGVNRGMLSDRDVEAIDRLGREIDLLAEAIACRTDAHRCPGAAGAGRLRGLPLGLVIGGGLAIVGGTALTAVGADGFYHTEIRKEDARQRLSRPIDERALANDLQWLNRQSEQNQVLLGVGIAVLVTGSICLTVGLVLHRRAKAKQIALAPFSLKF